MMHDNNNHRVPSNISMLFTNSEQVHHHFTRFSPAGNLYVKTSRTNQLLFSFARIGITVWNSIPMKLRIKNRTPFKREHVGPRSLKKKQKKTDRVKTQTCPTALLLLSYFSVPRPRGRPVSNIT